MSFRLLVLCAYEKEKFGHMKMEDWRDASTQQGTPQVASKPPEVGKKQAGFPDRFPGSMALLMP